MLSINNLTIQLGTRPLFNAVSAQIYGQDRIGLVGVNGAGKSTLLKIMDGQLEADDGVINQARYIKTAYLPQEINTIPSSRTIFEEAQTVFADVMALQQELDGIQERLGELAESSDETIVALNRLGELQHQIEQADIFRQQAAIEKVLSGLGFKEKNFNRPCHTYSGGWLMRLFLAKLLLGEPSLLLLDEPTNHLDLDSLLWLEDFLKGYSGAMVIVSHDRTFLDNITRLTWELSMGMLSVYKGNYSQYCAQKESREQIQRAAYANQQAQIRQTMRFVERFRAKSTKASQVQSRLRQLNKMELIELEDDEDVISFRFPSAAPSGRTAISVDSLFKRYDTGLVFADVSFSLQRGDSLAVVGVNGAGKSTLARILAGLESPDQGKVKLGHNVIPSYFGQHQAQELIPDRTVLETIAEVEHGMTVTQIRSLLGAFLFRGDDVGKKVEVLSGGEKSRLALAKMLITPANLLILDEPTNHLDMSSQDVLTRALARYDGTIIVISHNRYFLNRFVNKVIEIKDGRATLHEGNLDDYLARLSVDNGSQEINDGFSTKALVKAGGKIARQEQARVRQKRDQRLVPLKKKVETCEQEIGRLEARKTEVEGRMADPGLYVHGGGIIDWTREYKEIDRLLNRYYNEWEESQAAIEEIEAAYGQESGKEET